MGFSDFITFFFIGVGLSFDSLAVSVSCGLMKQEIRFRQALLIASSFGFFHALFPLIGWLVGHSLQGLIDSVDHWIAFALLALTGIKMIIEGAKPDGSLERFDPLKLRVLLGFSVATSIDALVVGLSFGFLVTPVWVPVIIISAITFIASMLGMLFGKKISIKRSHQALIPGGIILVLIGVKILIEHLWL